MNGLVAKRIKAAMDGLKHRQAEIERLGHIIRRNAQARNRRPIRELKK